MSISKKVKNLLFITLSLIMAFYVSIYVMAINSEPYDVASRFLHKNAIVKTTLGEITNDRPSFFGYEIMYKGSGGKARFEIVMSSKSGSANAYLHLKRSMGAWRVIKAVLYIPGSKSIDLLGENSGQ